MTSQALSIFLFPLSYPLNLFTLKSTKRINSATFYSIYLFLAQVIWAYRAKHDIVVRVCVCVSVNIDLWVNSSGTVYPINLKFCSVIVKAIVSTTIYNPKRTLLLVTRNGSQYGSKHQFYQFFKNNSKTKSGAFLIFWYVIELITRHVFVFTPKF